MHFYALNYSFLLNLRPKCVIVYVNERYHPFESVESVGSVQLY